MCSQEQLDKALQAVQSGRPRKGVSNDIVGAAGAEDDKAVAEMSLSEVERWAAAATLYIQAGRNERSCRHIQ